MAATAPHQKDPAHVAAGKWSQALEQQALRIARKWQNGTLSDAQKGIIQAVLVPVLCPEGSRPHEKIRKPPAGQHRGDSQ